MPMPWTTSDEGTADVTPEERAEFDALLASKSAFAN
jgi:hypothetical protein